MTFFNFEDTVTFLISVKSKNVIRIISRALWALLETSIEIFDFFINVFNSLYNIEIFTDIFSFISRKSLCEKSIKNQIFIPLYTRIICHVFKVSPFNLYRNTVYILSNYTLPKKLQSTISCTNLNLNFILRHLILTFQNVFLLFRDLRYCERNIYLKVISKFLYLHVKTKW